MASNPFENPDENYSVLINDEGQHSLWPISIEVPEGWKPVLENASRQDCLGYVDTHWTDMRTVSLQRVMGESST